MPEFRVDRAGQPGFGETNHLCAADVKDSFQVICSVVLHHGIRREVTEDRLAAARRNVSRDQDKVQLASAAP